MADHDRTDRTAKALDELALQLAGLRDRVQRLEARAAEIDRRAEVVASASRSWRAVMVTRSCLVLTSDAGDRGTIAVDAARLLAAGKRLDAEVGDAEGGSRVQLVDARKRIVADVPRAALTLLPKILASPDAIKLLESAKAPANSAGVRSSPAAVRDGPAPVRTGQVVPEGSVASEQAPAPKSPANSGALRSTQAATRNSRTALEPTGQPEPPVAGSAEANSGDSGMVRTPPESPEPDSPARDPGGSGLSERGEVQP